MHNPEKKSGLINSSEITDKALFDQRRALIKASMALGAGSIAAGSIGGSLAFADEAKDSSGFQATDELTAKETATSYNNFYELGTDKGDPLRNADRLKTSPWSVVIDGECDKPGTYTLEDILKPHDIEERIYRLRCVEAWSMVIPWNGFSLGDLLKRFEPRSTAKYVSFETVNDHKRRWWRHQTVW